MPIKPKRWAFTPISGSATNIRAAASATTGAVTFTSTTLAGPLAYYLLLTTTAADQARVLTIVGTNSDGQALTESINLPNASTAITVNAFKTITSITLDAGGATIGNLSIGTSNATRAALSPTMPIDVYSEYTTTAVDISGTINFTVQKCYELVNRGETANWVTAQAAGAIDVVTAMTGPVAGVRLLISSYTNTATIAMSVMQAGLR